MTREQLYDQGKLAFEQGRVDDAIAFFERSRQFGGSGVGAIHLALCVCHLRQSNIGAAKIDAQNALAADPSNPEVYFRIGNIAEMEQRFDDALMNYRQTAALRPEFGGLRERMQYAMSRLAQTAGRQSASSPYIGQNPTRTIQWLPSSNEYEEYVEKHTLKNIAEMQAGINAVKGAPFLFKVIYASMAVFFVWLGSEFFTGYKQWHTEYQKIQHDFKIHEDR